MDSSIIFEQKYSQFIHNICNDVPENYTEISAVTITGRDSSAYIKNLLENAVCVLIPNRMEKRNYFINLAKEIAEAYLIDIVIKEHHDRITVLYTLEYDASFHCLKPIIHLADEFSFHEGKEAVLISLEYYTHATYQSGHKVLPLSD